MNESEIGELVKQSLSGVLKEKGLNDFSITPETQIFGSGSVIDSMDLVGVIVQIEESIHEKTGKRIEVVDESSVISEDSPFKTVLSLTRYVTKKCSER